MTREDTKITQDFPGWPVVLSQLFRGEDLSFDLSRLALIQILSGDTPMAHAAAFVAALRTKGESVSEVSGMASAMLEFATKVDVDPYLVDTCGTGGDRSMTINVSTMAALIVAGAGVKVCKHGGRASSSKSGSADVLESLGVKVDIGPSLVAECIAKANIGFCFAPKFHPAMANVASLRRELGVPTVFNFLGPLVNPARAKYQVVGVSDPAMAETMVGVLANQGSERAMVVYGEDGLDEISTTAVSCVLELSRDKDGQPVIRRYKIDPADLGIALAGLDDLRGGEASENAVIVREVLQGSPGPKADIAILNAGAALYICGAASSIGDGIGIARQSIASGAALRALEGLISSSQGH
ncbi:MAG: anthranilate phosphoribosyltransferase [Acidimicrobiaceae bacterium]|nr:anthranilate phosphoribosyltransferase [Acidimicrobiaceae bacterium]